MSLLKIGEMRRPQPTAERLAWRSGFLEALRWLRPTTPKRVGMPRGLSRGNQKIGITGSIYKSVFVWNLPAVACCPGASQWCLGHCYNADDRSSVFPIGEWLDNWYWVENEPKVLTETINAQLRGAEPPVAVRIHSSGDFYSSSYAGFWQEIVEANADVAFWGYTRSWSTPALVESLNNLRRSRNVQLFASWDSTMPAVPPGWRIAHVSDEGTSESVADEREFVCPEQMSQVSNCASCGFCMRSDLRGVVFCLH